jgi:membrane protease YdiL (CAAX protease family)
VEAVPVFFMALLGAAVFTFALALVVRSKGAVFVLAALISELAFGAMVLVWVRFVSHGPLRALGAPTRPLRDLGWGVLAGAGLTVTGLLSSLVVVAAASLILGHRPGQPVQIPAYVNGLALALSGPVVVLAAPFGEELLFRGFLYKGLRRRFGVWSAALIAGAFFALLHGAPILVFAIFPIGVGLALVYEWRQSILASMAAHATFNLIGFLTILVARR